jgi:hypothetical protein
VDKLKRGWINRRAFDHHRVLGRWVLMELPEDWQLFVRDYLVAGSFQRGQARWENPLLAALLEAARRLRDLWSAW